MKEIQEQNKWKVIPCPSIDNFISMSISFNFIKFIHSQNSNKSVVDIKN